MPEITQDLLNQIKTDHDNIIEKGGLLLEALHAFNVARGRMAVILEDFEDEDADDRITRAFDNAFPNALHDFHELEGNLMSSFFATRDETSEVYRASLG